MKTFNLTLAALAISAVASTSALASSLDATGNIPNHESNIVSGATDSIYTGTVVNVSRGSSVATGLTQTDAALLKLRTDGDLDPRVRSN